MTVYLLLTLSLISPVCFVDAASREYFIGILEVEWDYAPTRTNVMKNISLEVDGEASVFTKQGETTIGKVYRKAVYREYIDATFTRTVVREEHWGIIGPPIKAEVGDKLLVHVKNMATHPYSMHPHGVLYTKLHEGALYHDKSRPTEKLDDEILPGSTHIYDWDVTPSFAPTDDDENCLAWAYHSHTDAAKDTNAGLVGPIVVCRRGTLDMEGNRKDIDKEFYFLFTVLDENESWYLEQNIQTYCSNPGATDPDDEDFQESNKMHGINGLMYGNLQGISMCKGDWVAIYLIGMGTEVDLHSVHFHGQTVTSNGHRQDTVSLFPGVFMVVMMEADNPGTFELSCAVNDHIAAGMLTSFTVHGCGSDEPDLISSDAVREFYIGVVEEDWNYGPSGKNLITNESLTAEGSESKTFFEKGSSRIGGTYKKSIYYGFDSRNFENKLPKPDTFGILGPLIAAEVGDVVRVTLKNFANSQAYNIEPHGVYYDDLTSVGAGEIRTYEWSIPDSVSPTTTDGDCVTYIYTSSVDPVADTNSGLVGPLLVCKKSALKAKLDRRSLFLLLTVFDENSSHYIGENIERFAPAVEDVGEDGFVESNLMHSLNGRMYGILQFNLCIYAETDIHALAIGTEVDIHSLFIEGLPYTFRNEYTNTLNVFPHTTADTTVKPMHFITGELICLVTDHLLGGMRAIYTVVDCGLESDEVAIDGGVTRTYYIAAVDEIWDYSPWKEEILDRDLSVFTKQETGAFIGSSYLKAVYHEYTDETFSTRKHKPVHLGLLGPIIKAEEDDVIKVVFRNLARRQYNMFPWGLDVGDYSTNGIAGVAPGETVNYEWKVPKEVLPRENEPLCNVHTYVSDVDDVKDVYTGLLGPLLICRKGGLTEDGWMQGAEKEFFLAFVIFDESNSHYLDYNVREFAGVEPDEMNLEDDDFLESNLMHSINGRLGFLEGLEMRGGDRVIWHLQGVGNEVDIHTVHFHAHSYKYTSDVVTHGDVFNLFPGKVGTIDMTVNAVGRWLLHCHVNDHVTAGMSTTYNVLPTGATLGRHPCHFMPFPSGRPSLECIFEYPRQITNLVKDVNQGLTVCPLGEDVYNCSEQSIDPSQIWTLAISTQFYLSSGDFRELLTPFTNIRTLKAIEVGLRNLEPDTFSSNLLLRRINLRGNRVRDIPLGMFSLIMSLQNVDLRKNQLEWDWIGLPTERFHGVRNRVDLRSNPGLGDNQGVLWPKPRGWVLCQRDTENRTARCRAIQ